MVTRATFALALLFSLSAVCHAAENDNSGKLKFELPSVSMGEYSLKLDTDAPKHLDAPAPTALIPLKRDSVQPFVGLSLSRPLPDNFLNFDN